MSVCVVLVVYIASSIGLFGGQRRKKNSRETMTRVGLFMHRQMMRVLVAVA